MAEYISKQAAVDAGYLSDWYISSVGDEPPVWTDAHIDELLNDFIVIPKDTKAADVQPTKAQVDLQLAYNEQMIELREAKRLLKLAVEDFSVMDNHIYSCVGLCDDCPLIKEHNFCFKWRYADEAMKLLKED